VQLGLDYPTKWGRQYPARFARNLYHRLYLAPYTRYISTLEVERPRESWSTTVRSSSWPTTPATWTRRSCIAALPAKIRRRRRRRGHGQLLHGLGTAFHTVLVFNAIPIDRHKVNRRSARSPSTWCKRDWNLLIFPEGGRTPDGELHEFKGGAAYLAERSLKTVIPMYIHDVGLAPGTQVRQGRQVRPRRPINTATTSSVTFGDAMHVAEGENIRRFNTRIVEAVVQLGREVSGDATYGIKPPELALSTRSAGS
jgi:1-acyl-sn-glycerol-3-phosphate acyltransferase